MTVGVLSWITETVDSQSSWEWQKKKNGFPHLMRNPGSISFQIEKKKEWIPNQVGDDSYSGFPLLREWQLPPVNLWEYIVNMVCKDLLFHYTYKNLAWILDKRFRGWQGCAFEDNRDCGFSVKLRMTKKDKKRRMDSR